MLCVRLYYFCGILTLSFVTQNKHKDDKINRRLFNKKNNIISPPPFNKGNKRANHKIITPVLTILFLCFSNNKAHVKKSCPTKDNKAVNDNDS